MVGADSIIKVIAAVLSLFVIAVVAGVGYTLVDPIYNQLFDAGDLASVGWDGNQDIPLRFMGLGFIGLTLVVMFWLISSPIRDDQRQDQGPPRGPV